MSGEQHGPGGAVGPSGPSAPVVVAIDGPAGSGKSSVSKAAAVALDYAFLDTGAAYRSLTWLGLERGIDLTDAAAVVTLLQTFHYSTEVHGASTIVRVADGEAPPIDVTGEIREPRVTAAVSDVARIPEVRVALTEVFRRLIRGTDRPGIVVEGRDITTVVAPDAQVRILLTASEDVRIGRRSAELSPDAASTASQLRERDRRDAQVVDFLTAAPGVTTIDSTELDFGQTVQAVVNLVRTTSLH